MKRFLLTVVILILMAAPALADDVFYPIVISKPCPPPPTVLAWTNSTPTMTGTYYFRPVEAEGSTWSFLATYDTAAPLSFPWPVQFAGPVSVPAGVNAVVFGEGATNFIPVPEEVLSGVPFEAVKDYANQLANSTGQ